MNTQWMRDQLAQYATLVEELAYGSEGRWDIGTETAVTRRKEMRMELRQREHTVKEILKRADPTLATFTLDTIKGAVDVLKSIQSAIGILYKMEVWPADLDQNAAVLPADQLHPWVWEAARMFWETNHYRTAVDAAARSINVHTQNKVGRRDISDTDLMNQVFTDKPKSGQTYFRLPGDPEDRTVQNRNRALRPFAEGCFAGIRALAAHEHGPDWDEQRALESLAALSILARWIDECDVHTAI